MFKGVIVPLITPFNEDYSIDFVGLEWLVKFLVEKGVDGIFPYSTTGEFVHLKYDEGIRIVERIMEIIDRKVKIIPGISANSTLNCIDLGKVMEDLGVDGVIATPPFFFKLNEDQLFEHFSSIAKKIDLPIIVYNIPSLTGNFISIKLYRRLAEEYSNIAGAKITYDSVSYMRDLIFELKATRKDFSILTGLDDLLLNTLILGGDGGIMACANFAPEIHITLYRSFMRGEYDVALEMHKKLSQLVRIYNAASSFPTAIKTALKIMNTQVKPYVRPPLRMERKEIEEKIREVLLKVGII